MIDNYKHQDKNKYPNQYIYVISIKDYIHYVPYIKEDDYIFLKNIIPSRKLNQNYKGFNMDYSAKELELLDVIESGNIQSVPFDNDNIKQMAKETRQYNQEKKQRADNIGISYQNIIQALVHNHTTNKISLNI
jgi:hypothetical protein